VVQIIPEVLGFIPTSLSNLRNGSAQHWIRELFATGSDEKIQLDHGKLLRDEEMFGAMLIY
jgi:hypothetical protein